MSAEPTPQPYSRRRSLSSAVWATAQQLVAVGSTAISGIILARVVPVADFGVFSYATSMASIGTTILTVGLAGLALKALVDDPARSGRTMTALSLIREVFAAVAFAALLSVSLSAGSATVTVATALALTVLFARAVDATEIWFQSRADSGKTAPIRISVVVVMLACRVLMALAGASLADFLILYVIEAFVTSALLLVRYLTFKGSPGYARPDARTPRDLLKKSWVLALSGVAGQVNSRGDVIVIQALLSSTAVGIYSAAARLSEMLYFLPAVFMTATFPRLLQIRKKHGHASVEYRRELQSSYDRACWAGIAIAIVLYFVGPPLLVLLYGAEYAASGAILQVHVLALPFVFMAAVFSKWIIAENLLLASLLRHGLGAALNIALNLALIPAMGILGSAVATAVSYLLASYLSCFLTKSTRSAGVMMTLALLFPIRLVRQGLRRSR